MILKEDQFWEEIRFPRPEISSCKQSELSNRYDFMLLINYNYKLIGPKVWVDFIRGGKSNRF
jgi:hypothetical protein